MKTVEDIRSDFPILKEKVNGAPLVYFDNGATNQKPKCVIDKLESYYSKINSNIHRGVHFLSQRATEEFEHARAILKEFINAKHAHEIILTKGTTDGINLVAECFGSSTLKAGDEVLITEMEHHSNIVPWQMICEKTGATLRWIPINAEGALDLTDIDGLINERTKIVSLVHISNALGTLNPVEQIIAKSKTVGAKVLIDAAQSAAHQKIDVQALDCDFMVFSSHKMCGPTGVGVLYGKEDLLNAMPPYQGGGDMIKEVTLAKTTYNDLPHKFEAGTPNIADVIAFGTAIEYIKEVGFDFIQRQEQELLDYATEEINKIEGIKIIGTAEGKASLISFIHEVAHPFDIGTILDQLGIAVRTGHHCAQPVMQKFNIPGTVRASFSFYNTKEEIDVFIAGLKKALKMLI